MSFTLAFVDWLWVRRAPDPKRFYRQHLVSVARLGQSICRAKMAAF
jgi:hypothetical protein